MAPITTTGFLLLTVRLRKKAVSSSVSVPCVMTMPLTFGSARSSLQRLASVRRTWSVRLLDEIFTICSPVTVA